MSELGKDLEIVRTEVEQKAFGFLKALSDSVFKSRTTPIVIDIYGDAVDMIIARDKEIQDAARKVYDKKLEQFRSACIAMRDSLYFERNTEWAKTAILAILAATEPATVELPKCDHCGAIACWTDCDGGKGVERWN